ncbi:MAG: H+/Na+-translocating ferredoxin:NAD+ oxidoreductase subunit, partial [Acidobacteriota bacterium]|nr:H+/Na+-translocating ferredoxin:NAD+ oxidoreductase subunit [Acidobacteriota bacterium]
IIEIRPKGIENKRVWINCVNKEKGGVAMKNCKVACIGCGKCVRECPENAISLNDNLATIDPVKCTACEKCIPVCPTNAIVKNSLRRPGTFSEKPSRMDGSWTSKSFSLLKVFGGVGTFFQKGPDPQEVN